MLWAAVTSAARRGGGKADQQGGEQNKGAHAMPPIDRACDDAVQAEFIPAAEASGSGYSPSARRRRPDAATP